MRGRQKMRDRENFKRKNAMMRGGKRIQERKTIKGGKNARRKETESWKENEK